MEVIKVNDQKPDTLMIIDIVQGPAIGPGGRPLSTRGFVSDRLVETTEHAIDELRNTMTHFLNGVQTMLAESTARLGDFEVDTVEVNAQITSEGKIGFAGTGLNLKGGTGLKIVLKRCKPE
jgi:hypothetical protein